MAANHDIIAELVVEAVLASDEAEGLPALVRTAFGGLLRASVADSVGNEELSVTLDSVTHFGDVSYGAVFIVEGTLTGLGAVSAVTVRTPVVLTLDLDEGVTLWEVSVPESTVTLETGG